MRLILILLLFGFTLQAQTNTYDISFKNAVHHEAVVKATFPNIKTKTVKLQMSRSSPGRYALHEFAKKGEMLDYTRPDPYSWEISGHDGTVNVEYTLFGNRGDGTYSQIDETHAHLNMPATFMYVDDIQYRPIEVTFQPREDLNWKIATQLKALKGNTFYAPNLYYFMDSPTEISDYALREFDLDGKHIRFVLHHLGTEDQVDTYFEKVRKIVAEEKAVYGELPDYDYGEYTFLACYMPNASGDGMEHRNSTILTDTEGFDQGGMENNIGTVSHEYFHSWNVERIRPNDLEPFKFDKANMSDALWFAEGFTSYYTNLILCRAGIITPEKYIDGLAGTFNYVWNSPARDYFNPIEMSRQAPFVDAATSVDPVNRENMFISYYSYGSVLGLALDLSLREKDLNLNDFMKKMWVKFGKTEVAYEVKDIEKTLSEYAGEAFAKAFFDKYIYKSEMPDYKQLVQQMGISLTQDETKPYLGASLKEAENGLLITRNTSNGSPAYDSGLDIGDVITAINDKPITSMDEYKTLIETIKRGDKVSVSYKSYGKDEKTEIKTISDPSYSFLIDKKASKNQLKARENWLKTD
ncbi:MAG: PDZ domain-containing protein [Leeuwenhoekiella sp.]